MKTKALIFLSFLAITSPADASSIGVGGVHASVAESASGPLQCVLNGLVSRGYPVRFIRGYGRGSVRGSLHPSGMALDVNQVRRGVTTPRMPHDEVAMASACGAISGAAWRNNDSGHFQVGGWSGSVSHRRHKYKGHHKHHKYHIHRHRRHR